MKRALVKAHLAKLDDQDDLEARCTRCGRCCYFISLVGGQRRRTAVSCPHLTADGCSRYATRLEVEWCLPLAEAIVRNEHPAGCPYVVGLRNQHGGAYRGPR